MFLFSCQTVNIEDNDKIDKNEGYLFLSVEAKALNWE